jgi:hypothetical protein
MVGNRSRELWGHTSGPEAYCEIAYEKAPTALHGPSGITYDLCDKNHEQQVETRVQALLASVDTPLGKVRPCDIHKLANSLKLREACGLDGIPDKCLRHLLRRPLVHLTHLFNHCFWLSHFPKTWKEEKVITYWNLVRTRNSLKIYKLFWE